MTERQHPFPISHFPIRHEAPTAHARQPGISFGAAKQKDKNHA